MPPEALIDQPMYDNSIDIFSFGHLALFSMIQVPQSNLTTVSVQQWVDWVHGCAGNPLLVESAHNTDFYAQVA